MLNGHHNNGHANNGDAGRHAEIIADMHATERRRTTRRVVLDTVKDVADLPPYVWRALAASCIKDLNSDSVGARRSARDHLIRLRSMGVDAAIAIDKMERLDAGESTENVAQVNVNVEFDRRG